MSGCCEDKACEVEALQARQSHVLWIVLAINASMFVVESAAGMLARSTALLGDSLDMLGDALAYAVSLYVLKKSDRAKAYAALYKGAVMGVLGVVVLVEAMHKVIHPVLPGTQTMGIMGALSLAANAICLALLWKSRGDNLNMRSVWLCSRNDLLVGVGIVLSAIAVQLSQSRWPDIVIGASLAMVVLHSSYDVVREAMAQIRSTSLQS